MTVLTVGSLLETEEGMKLPLVTITGRNSPSGESKNWEPVPEYLNSNSANIAMSDDFATWPEYWNNKLNDPDDPGWCGAWNSYFGKNYFIKGNEIYTRISDDMNFISGYTYYPDETDSSRKGAGFIADCRTLEFDLEGLQDVIFHIYSLHNDGTKMLDTNIVGLWVADLVGGDGDSGDDLVKFDLDHQVVWFQDKDSIGNASFGSDLVGIPAITFLKTPDNKGISAIRSVPAGSVNIDNDNYLWTDLLFPGEFQEMPENSSGDFDSFISSGFFSLAPGEKKEFIYATIFSENINEMYDKIDTVKIFYDNGFEPNPPQYAKLILDNIYGFAYADSSPITLNVKLTDYFGNGLSNIQINLETGYGFIDESVITDSAGSAKITFSIGEVPESGHTTIFASAEDVSFGIIEKRILLEVIPGELHGDTSIPVPFDLKTNISGNNINLLWASEYTGENSSTLFYCLYNYNIYRNGELISQVSREPDPDYFWSRDSIWDSSIKIFASSFCRGTPLLAEYRIEFGEVGIDTSYSYSCLLSNFPESAVNFTVKKRINTTGDDALDWEKILFAFGDFSPQGNPNGILNADSVEADWVIFLDDTTESGESSPSWRFSLKYPSHYEMQSILPPQSGDTVFINTYYKFIDDSPIAGNNCYQVSRFYPLNSNSSIFQPGSESILSNQVCINLGNQSINNGNDIISISHFDIKALYPNPFNPVTTIKFSIDYSEVVTPKNPE